MLVYLSGPIMGCDDSECFNWRKEAEEQLPNTLNPLRRDFRNYKNATYLECSTLIKQDKKDIDESDIILVYYSRPSTGTAMEMMYAWQRRKNIILVTACDNVPPWARIHCSLNTNNLKVAIRHILNIS